MVCTLLHADFLLGFLLDPKDGVSKFLRNIGVPVLYYMTLHPKRQVLFFVLMSTDPGVRGQIVPHFLLNLFGI
jgi:hypothetical protein